MFEKKIVIIGTKKIHSKAKNQDFYLVEYVKEGTYQKDYINENEYNKLSSKAKPMIEQTGIFNINLYNKAYLCDVK